MKRINKKPPVYDKCKEKFDINWNKGIAFAYDGNIYCKRKLLKSKIAHEKVHIEQQTEMGVEKWWDKYLEDDKFRLSQEMEAYTGEVIFLMIHERDYKKRDKMLEKILRDFSSSMYGNIISYEAAKQRLKI